MNDYYGPVERRRRSYKPTNQYGLGRMLSVKLLDTCMEPTNWNKYWRNELWNTPKRSQYNVVYK